MGVKNKMNHHCEEYCKGQEKVDDVKSELEKIDLKETTNLFKVLAEENRAKIIFSLLKANELCVHDLANITGMTTANTSHHLRTLYAQGLVKFRKEGRLSHYSLDDHRIERIFGDALALETGEGIYV